MRIGADMQRSHRGCSVKYGVTSQLAWNAASALSKVSVCPQQRQVYVGIFQDGEASSIQRRAVAPTSIMRERLGASRLRSQTRRWRGLDPPDALPFLLAVAGATASFRLECTSYPRPTWIPARGEVIS